MDRVLTKQRRWVLPLLLLVVAATALSRPAAIPTINDLISDVPGIDPAMARFMPERHDYRQRPVLRCDISYTVQVADSALPPKTRAQSFSGTLLIPHTIAFAAVTDRVAGTSFALVAATSSNLTVSFASTTPSVCTVSGTMATTVAVGTCTITASQDGNATYAPADPVSQSFQVTRGLTTITFALGNQALGTAPSHRDGQHQRHGQCDRGVQLRCLHGHGNAHRHADRSRIHDHGNEGRHEAPLRRELRTLRSSDRW